MEEEKSFVALRFERLSLAIGFECQVSLLIYADAQRIETPSVRFDAARGEALFPAEKHTATVTHDHSKCVALQINVIVHSRGSKKCAGVVNLRLGAERQVTAAKVQLPLERCPDRLAQLSFSYCVTLCRSDRLNSAIAPSARQISAATHGNRFSAVGTSLRSNSSYSPAPNVRIQFRQSVSKTPNERKAFPPTPSVACAPSKTGTAALNAHPQHSQFSFSNDTAADDRLPSSDALSKASLATRKPRGAVALQRLGAIFARATAPCPRLAALEAALVAERERVAAAGEVEAANLRKLSKQSILKDRLIEQLVEQKEQLNSAYCALSAQANAETIELEALRAQFESERKRFANAESELKAILAERAELEQRLKAESELRLESEEKLKAALSRIAESEETLQRYRCELAERTALALKASAEPAPTVEELDALRQANDRLTRRLRAAEARLADPAASRKAQAIEESARLAEARLEALRESHAQLQNEYKGVNEHAEAVERRLVSVVEVLTGAMYLVNSLKLPSEAADRLLSALAIDFSN